MWASARRHPEMMQLLISKGADVNARSIDRNYQRHVTAEGRPKSLDSGGLTPLLYAARENCMACVEVLLENGADIDLPDPDGVSPLLVAIMNANWDLARQLILAGADVNQWDIYGEAPLFTAIDLRSRIDGGRASIDPLNKTNGLTIVNMLLERGANPNMQLFFKPANVRGRDQYAGLHAADPRGQQRRISRSSSCCWNMAPTPRSTWRTGRRRSMRCSRAAPRSTQALELIRVLQKAGADVNVVALVNHGEESSGRHGAALRRPQALERGHQAARLLRHRHERQGSGRPHGAGLYAVPRLHAVHGAADSGVQGGGGASPRAGRDQTDGSKPRVAGPGPTPGRLGGHLAAG